MKANTYDSTCQAARKIIEAILAELNKEKEKVFNIAVSGGTTPVVAMDIWANDYSEQTPWDRIQFYWVDERCVWPDSPESNYGTAKRFMFDFVPVPLKNIHPIIGPDNAEEEAKRYSAMVKGNLPCEEGIPIFDFVLLGIGDDGHTSSIFPNRMDLMESDKIYVATVNPYNLKKRVAMTGPTIMSAKRTWFFVTGPEKANVVKNIFENKERALLLPAGYVAWNARNTEFFLDRSAAAFLSPFIK